MNAGFSSTSLQLHYRIRTKFRCSTVSPSCGVNGAFVTPNTFAISLRSARKVRRTSYLNLTFDTSAYKKTDWPALTLTVHDLLPHGLTLRGTGDPLDQSNTSTVTSREPAAWRFTTSIRANFVFGGLRKIPVEYVARLALTFIPPSYRLLVVDAGQRKK
jgi:hypothetical protein